MDNFFEGSEEHPARERGIATIRVLGLLAVFLIFAMATAESSGATGFRADKLSAGVGHSCAIRDGGAWCWGSNSQGELGNGTTDDSAVPVPVTGFSSGVTDIAAGSGHTCAIKDGGAWCWGTNQVGELGNGSFGGTQISNPLPIPVTGLDTGVTAISAGRGYSCASRFRVGASYESYCWGSNLNWRVSGEDGAVPWEIPLPTWTGVAMPFLTVSAGYGEHTCTIVEAGVVPWQSTQARCWGNNEYGQSGRRLNLDPGSGQPFEYFPSPMKKAIVINNDIPGTKQLTAISAGQDHTCLVNLGGVMCQGKNHHGQLGDGTTTHTTAKSETPDERHIGWVSGLGPGSDVTSILTGFAHSCALSTTKGMRCWGYNRDGQLGDGTWGVGNQSTVPVQATAFEAHGEVTAISGLSMRTCAIVGGGIWCNGFMDDPGPHPVPEAPLVTISAPSDGALLTTPSVEVTFGVTGTPTPACKVDGADEAGPTATVPLTLGVNTIAVTCTSSSGSDTATVQVHRYSQLPVAIIQPSAASTTSSAINVAYSVNGQSTIPDDSSCKVNGNASTDPTLNEVQLSPGANTITVICSNPATTQTATATIGRYSPLSVAITDPADGAGTIDGQVNVAYTVNGESSIPDDSSCKVNGGSSSDSAINEVNLALGANMVTVSCSNPAGSESAGITVYRNQAPVISDIMPRGQPYATAEPETDVSFTVAGYPAPSCTVNGRPSGGRTTETLEPGMNYFVIR
ncbi:MAG: hypothetical protein IT199_06105, partial [Solirubrobacterales bacterium]|nr:hypothetical protein [Solirubrobacterales bacterium]